MPDYPKCATALVTQSVIFPRNYGAVPAKQWLRKHKLKAPNVERTKKTLRFRQRDPSTCVRNQYATIPMGETGIKKVLCCPAGNMPVVEGLGRLFGKSRR
jgi:hypothetical protein